MALRSGKDAGMAAGKSSFWRNAFVVLALAMGGAAASAAVEFPALDRPAMAVRSPERTVLLAAALAGSRAVAVGERGVVVLSDDSGKTWRQAKSVPVAVTLTAVQFIDPQHGWAVGHGGVVLHSKDAGESWVRQADGRTLAKAALAAMPSKSAQALASEGPDKPLLDVRFADANRGYVVGAYNLAFETRDGGATWSSLMGRLDNPKGSHLYSLAVRGDSIFIAGEQGIMVRSQDGGATFSPVATSNKSSWFSVVATADRGLVATGLRGNAMFSRDDGETWTSIEGAPPFNIVGGLAMPDGTALLANQAGQLLATRSGGRFASLALASSLPPPAGMLMLPDGALLVVGVTGAIRLPAPSVPDR